ncbi:hypothetical protein [Corynebacterium belfantii]|uniref:hypothetical protein n=1 Tax=Corynebacterium belfantii TaxID=2014537 RepID=UPI0035A91BD2
MRKLSKVAIAVAITVSAACSGIAYAQTSHADQVTQQQDEARLADGLNSTRQESTNKNLAMLLLTGTGPRECPIVCVRGAWFTSSPRIGRGKPRLVG